MKRLYMLFLFVLGIGITAYAQRNVSGSVSDEEGEPLIGANVLVQGTSIGTSTDINGNFLVEVPEGSDIIVISYTGYETRQIQLGVSNLLNITLQEGLTLSEAVVTALGIQREEKSVGYAVQEVSGSDVEKANTINVIDAISGKAAGVYVTPASGAAGAPSRIVLRGQTSFNGDNEALIVVDGVRLDNSEYHTERELGGVANSSRGMDLNPYDVESITVLKGAAATALYGVEGARGVVLITTKKGGSKAGGGVSVSFNSNFTVSEVNKLPEYQNRYVQGVSGVWLGAETAGFNKALSWGPRVDTLFWDGSTDYKWDRNGRIVGQSDPSAAVRFTPYDNYDAFYQRGNTFANNVAITGGNDEIGYRLSFGHTDQEGVIPLNEFIKTNLGFGATADLFDGRLHASTTVNYVKSGGRRIQQGSNTSGVNLGLFRSPISFDNANGFSSPWNSPEAYSFPDGSQRNYRGGVGYDNPFWIVALNPMKDNVNRMFGNFKLTYDLHDWVSVSTTVGTDFYSDFREQEFEIGSNNVPAGQVIDDKYNYRHTDFYFNVHGNGQVGQDFSVNYNVGLNLYSQSLEQVTAQGDGLNFFGFRDLANAQAITTLKDEDKRRNIGVFGSADIGYKSFLYLTITGRNDWISTLIVPSLPFDEDAIDVFYPSASLSFVFSELIDIPKVSFGKLRFSYAVVGGGAPNAYLTSTPFIAQNTQGTIFDLNDGWTNGILFPFRGVAGFTYSALQGAETLKPSKTTDYEVGLDVRFFNNRLGLDATYYTRSSDDQIIPINVPNSSGFIRAVLNSGELKTRGGEVVLFLNPVRTRDWNWDISLNFSRWKTTVESLPPGVPNQYLDGFTGTGVYNIAPETDANGNVTKKFEYGQILGGAFQHVNDVDASGNPVFNPEMPYNAKGALVIGSDGYPLADPVARVIGNPNPDFLLGINNTVTWKGISVTALFDIKEGGEMWNGTNGAMAFFGTSKITENRDVVDTENPTYVYEGVTTNGQPNTKAVSLDENWYTGNGGGFGSVDEHFIEDASYRRLRLLSVAYTFPRSLFDNKLSDLTLSFTGRNLWLDTPYSGIDPETSLVGSNSNGQGLDYFQFPNTRSYSVGLSVKF